ncbi:MAG: 23S rRNA (adenine(2503)-C(2))-methyltransferase RlmN [Bacteroidales bacterium]|nr:23S rRNA (adenine(2503)-C(2))-methyltransferase RlmN [Bacteroidales bacterium]
MRKEILIGRTLPELHECIQTYGLPRFAAKEIARWIYQRGARDISAFTNLSKTAREQLAADFEIGISAPVKVSESVDGTKKYLYTAPGNKFVEAAYIPGKKRNTLCVSSQVGCKLGCAFCMTGKQGFQAQLSVGQILNQILSLPEREELTNLVFMGMGEPFDNTEAVMKALEILTADYGLHFSPRRITVSTVGLIPGMKTFLEESKCHLAVSLHSPFDDERRQLMPVQKSYPVQEVIDLLKLYPWDGQRRVSFEYILFRGINDTPGHVNQLASLLDGLKCRINLMHFHTIPDSELKGCSNEELIQFRDRLNRKGLIATIRESRGEDILAACGLLSTKEVNKKS